MTQTQEISREMLFRVKYQLSNRSLAIIAEMMGVDDAIIDMNNKMLIVKEKALLQAIDRTGFAVQKAAKRKIMVDKTLEPLNRAKSHGLNINDPYMVNEFDQSQSHLMALNYQECAVLCEALHNAMLALLPDLASVGVTAAMLTEQLASITAFNSYEILPRQGINDKKAATEALSVALGAAVDTLPRIDAAVLMLKNTHYDFYKDYFNARELVMVGGSTLALRVHVTTADGLPLKNVRFNIEDMELDKKTSAKGNFQMKNLAPGMHNGTFTKNGFKTVAKKIAITATERTEITIVMEEITVAVNPEE